jgi:hypothetical protein
LKISFSILYFEYSDQIFINQKTHYQYFNSIFFNQTDPTANKTAPTNKRTIDKSQNQQAKRIKENEV